MSLKITFISANRADPDEMPPYVAFHLGLLCLPKYPYTGIQNEEDYFNSKQHMEIMSQILEMPG